ncbi:hematopoietic death receptor isoform X1 [Labrus mixtus]|uniref:hematopoietic death receptor isoform X1 n=1 Tax=Labrus mixtus TaxID=508554 RepID=UPI0029C0545F|nr:hematopoietic death receptor isoform X1 [Labrus mixtus]
MRTLLKYMVFLVLFLPVVFGSQTSGLDMGIRKVRREIYCADEEEYRNGDMCCLNCPAGYRMISPCTENEKKGRCEKCDDGRFTEHSNGLKQCFKCTQCRPDQDILKTCSHTQNTECQCRSGGFCAPDQACEVCKKCSRCDKDEETVKNCTSTTNTVCKPKTKPSPASVSEKAIWIVPLLLFASGLIVVCVLWLRRRRATESQRNQSVGLKDGQHDSEESLTEERRTTVTHIPSYSNPILSRQLVRPKSFAEDEHQVLFESLDSSASNSQHCLLSSSAFPTSPPRARLMVPQPHRREEEEFPKLFPVNGEESLRNCFEYFEEMDVTYLKRFFRKLGMSDNVINSKEHLLFQDKIHDLLNIWMEKEGRDGSLNNLLKALLDLNQRRTAETIKEKAVHNGHYHL